MLKIVSDKVKSLRKKSFPCELPLKEDERKILLEMIDYLRKSSDEEYCAKHKIRSGVGLAAPQVGVNKRMLAISYTHEDQLVEYCLVNPKIVENSLKEVALSNGEGCLSVENDHKGYVYRSYKIKVKAYDLLQDKDIEIVAKGYDAIVLQHEIDHLDGILYYDRIDRKDPYKRKDNAILI